MKHKRNRYITSILITLLSVLYISCSDNPAGNKNTIPPVPSTTTPIWPQSGYNSQNTSNMYAPKVICNTVKWGQVDWHYFFPNTYYSDGAEFCVDSKNNVYFFSQQGSSHKIYKFTHDGTIIWIKESSNADNFVSISLSTDETKIYFNTSDGLHCYDSSGNNIWVSYNSGYYTKPAIGKDGTIYTKNYSNIAAINPDGSLKWTAPASLDPYSVTKISLDREDNIYIAEVRITKLDKNGVIIWSYTPEEENFITESVIIDGYGNLYFINDRKSPSSNLYSLTKDGNLRWVLNNNSFALPVIGNDNRIYAVGASIYCVDTAGDIFWFKPMPQGIIYGESLIRDDYGNLYFLCENFGVKAVSLDINGNLRWTADLLFSGLLPRPALIPTGKMLIAPKRARIIECVK